MAEKKQTLASLKMQLGKLQKKEQTAEVMQQVDELKLQIADFIPKDNVSKPKLVNGPGSDALWYEVWEVRAPFVNGVQKIEKVRMLKTTNLLPEQAETLNLQTLNSLKQYIKKED